MECLTMSGTTHTQWATSRLSLNQWMEQVQHGDMNSFNRLVSAYQDQVYRIAYRVLGDADSAAHATEQTFATAQRRYPRLGSNALRSWLMSLIIRICHEQVAMRPPQRLNSGVGSPDRAAAFRSARDEAPQVEPGPRVLDALIQRALATLAFEQRIAVVLADMEGCSYKEIAEITGVGLEAVASRLACGRMQLAKFLRAHAGELPATFQPV